MDSRPYSRIRHVYGVLESEAPEHDLAAQHAFNPGWPPHAKFHDAP